MTNAEYERLYAIGDILRHLRNADWHMKKAVESGIPWNPTQLDKVDDALAGLRDTFSDLEVVNRADQQG